MNRVDPFEINWNGIETDIVDIVCQCLIVKVFFLREYPKMILSNFIWKQLRTMKITHHWVLNNELSKNNTVRKYILNKTCKAVLNKRKDLYDHLSSVHLFIFNTLNLEIQWIHQSPFTYTYKY